MITDEQKKLIREMSEQGQSATEIAEQLGINEKTVRRYKKSPAQPQEAESTEDNSITSNNTISTPDLSSADEESSKKQDELKGRHFCYVVYPSETWVKSNLPQCEYDGSSGWGEAPDDWTEQLQNTGLPFVVSPIHDKDVNPDNTKKKPHWHVIISWGNTTTYRSARTIAETILRCPKPQLLKSVEGMYRYLTHADNPEKHQYTEKPKCYGGWTRPLDSSAIVEIKREIRKLLYLEDCTEYGELVAVCEQRGTEYFDVVSSHTFFFDTLCRSFRHKPIRTLSRVITEYEGEEQTEIEKLLQRYLGGKNNEGDYQ